MISSWPSVPEYEWLYTDEECVEEQHQAEEKEYYDDHLCMEGEEGGRRGREGGREGEGKGVSEGREGGRDGGRERGGRGRGRGRE